MHCKVAPHEMNKIVRIVPVEGYIMTQNSKTQLFLCIDYNSHKLTNLYPYASFAIPIDKMIPTHHSTVATYQISTDATEQFASD